MKDNSDYETKVIGEKNKDYQDWPEQWKADISRVMQSTSFSWMMKVLRSMTTNPCGNDPMTSSLRLPKSMASKISSQEKHVTLKTMVHLYLLFKTSCLPSKKSIKTNLQKFLIPRKSPPKLLIGIRWSRIRLLLSRWKNWLGWLRSRLRSWIKRFLLLHSFFFLGFEKNIDQFI